MKVNYSEAPSIYLRMRVSIVHAKIYLFNSLRMTLWPRLHKPVAETFHFLLVVFSMTVNVSWPPKPCWRKRTSHERHMPNLQFLKLLV